MGKKSDTLPRGLALTLLINKHDVYFGILVTLFAHPFFPPVPTFESVNTRFKGVDTKRRLFPETMSQAHLIKKSINTSHSYVRK